MSNTNRFNVGDVVEHKASGQKGVIMRVHSKCVNPDHPDFVPHVRRSDCQIVFLDVYDLSTGFGIEPITISGLELK